jgi:hypothetical protein
MSASALLSPEPIIRCRSAGRLRGFIRSRILLARWKPRALPAASTDAVADAELAPLVGPDMLAPMSAALGDADSQARHIGGCARDAYTMLYLCAALAVLFAACGVAATDNHTLLNVLVLAELATLLVLLLTFRKAHRVNWHGRWLALRFHVEFLRCLPLLAAMRSDSMQAHQADDRDASDATAAPQPPHLAALSNHHGKVADARSDEHPAALRATRASLYQQLHARCLQQPDQYAALALAYARTVAGQQLRYHCMRAQQEQAIVHRVHALSIGAFGLTIVAVAAHFWWHAALLTIISTGVPAFAASLHGFMAQEESERLAASSTSMAIRLQGWLDLAPPAPGELAAMQSRLAELVDLMMAEAQDWHRLFGEKGMYHLG